MNTTVIPAEPSGDVSVKIYHLGDFATMVAAALSIRRVDGLDFNSLPVIHGACYVAYLRIYNAFGAERLPFTLGYDPETGMYAAFTGMVSQMYDQRIGNFAAPGDFRIFFDTVSAQRTLDETGEAEIWLQAIDDLIYHTTSLGHPPVYGS